jgi:hypothetical protein
VAAPVAAVAGSAARLEGKKSHVLCVSGAVSYQPVRYSRFRKSFAAATFVTRMFSPS